MTSKAGGTGRKQAGLFPEEECRALGERILGFVTADEALVTLERRREMATRFAGNAVSFNAASERMQVSVQVAFGARSGSAEVESVEEDALRAVVLRAEEAARQAPEDPEFLPFLGPQEVPQVEAFCPDTAAVGGEEQIRLAGAMIAPARSAGMTASGTVETGETVTGLLSSRGLFAYHARTDAECGCTMAAADSSGWARLGRTDVRRLDASALAGEALAIARIAAGPRSLPPGRYTTIFRPAAVADLVPGLVGMSDARQTDAGLTYLSGKVGERLAGEEITLRSDAADPSLPTRPFASDGRPRNALAWIERGRFQAQICDRWTAGQSGRPAHPYPGSFLMDGTDRSLDDLIAGIERGVLVTRLWYIRPIKLEEALFTGMTRDGTLLIEDGKIVGGVHSMRFNDTILGMVQRVTDIGRAEACGGRGVCAVFPPLVVRDWEFVSASGA